SKNHSLDQHHFYCCALSRLRFAPGASASWLSRPPSSAEEGSGFSPIFSSSAIALRRFRPTLEATVQLRDGLPIWIAFQGVHGPIATSGGPWHTSGDWWRPTMWDREEWDVEV